MPTQRRTRTGWQAPRSGGYRARDTATGGHRAASTRDDSGDVQNPGRRPPPPRGRGSASRPTTRDGGSDA
jgi:hypothetical protein